MKKSVSLKLIVFSFLLVSGSVAYSAAPTIEAGTGADSTKAGINNDASGEESSAFGYSNKASEERSSAFGYNNEVTGLESSVLGNNYKVTGNHSGAFGIGTYDEVNHKHLLINGGGNSYMIGNGNNIADGASDNFILGNNVDIGVDSNGRKIVSSVVLGHGSSVSESEVVSVGTPDGGRRIVNVREARINATSNDATTGK